MPLPILRKQRNIKIYSIYTEIFNIHQAVLKEMGLLQEKESPALSSIQPSTEMPVEGGSIDKAKRLLEQVFSVSLGGHEKVLPYCEVEMDTGSDALYRGYRDFWMAHMREVEKISPKQIEAADIDNPYVLIMEFCLRLAMQALRLDSPLRSDQKRRIFIEILTRFGVMLSKKGILSITLQAKLFEDHKKWLDILTDTADKIDELNISKPVLKENLKYLKSLENNIIRHLMICLTDKDLAKKDVWQESLSEDQLNETLRQCEDRILNAATKKGLIKTGGIVAKGIIEMSVVVQRNTLPKSDNELSEKDFQEYDLTGTCGIGIPDTHRQKHVIGYFDNTSVHLKVKYLYGLWNKTKIIYHFLGRIDSLVQSAGWLPLLFHVVELSEVDAAIRFQATLCNKVFEICKKDYNKLFNTCLGTELGQCTLSDSRMPKSLPKLEQLQQPELLSTVFAHMALDFSELGKMGAWLGCQVIENPYLNKAVRIMAEPTQTLPMKPAQDLPLSITGSPPITRIKKTLSFQKDMPPLGVPMNSQSEPPRRRNKASSLLWKPEKPTVDQPKLLGDKSKNSLEDAESIKTTPEQPQLPPKIPPFMNKIRRSKSRSEPAPSSTGNSSQAPHLSITEESSAIVPESPVSKALTLSSLEDNLRVPTALNTPSQEQPSNLSTMTHSSPENKNTPPAKLFSEKTGASSHPQTSLPTSSSEGNLPSLSLHLSSVPHTSSKAIYKEERNPCVTIEMPRMSDIYLQQEDKKQTEEEDEDVYLARVPYIKTLVNILGLSVAQIAQGTEIFDTNENYFEQGNFSPFRREVVKVIKAFFSGYIGFVAPKGSELIWGIRAEEITMLKYFCTGPRDDSSLFLFIERMRKLTDKPWLSKYNELVISLEGLLDLHYAGKLEAILEHNSNTAEIKILRKQNQKVSEENKKLLEDVRIYGTKNSRLLKEKEELQSFYVNGMNSLSNQVGNLEKKLAEQQNQYMGEINKLRTEFGPLFKPEVSKNSPQPPREERKDVICNIL